MKKATLLLALIGLALAGCDDKTSPQGSGAGAQSQVKDEDLVTKSDFDAEAQSAITESNYKGELDALEKEISAQ